MPPLFLVQFIIENILQYGHSSDALPFGDKNMQKFMHKLKDTLLFTDSLVSF